MPKLNKTSKAMYIDETCTLKVTGTKQYILWKSSDKTVATVSKKGKVTAKNIGTCTITATIGAGINGQKISCKIKVQSRLSCKNTFIKCYADEYETTRINVRNLSEYESLVIDGADNKIISADWNHESDYFDIKNDSITFFIISYPDRTGWISSSDLDNYDLHFTPKDDGNYMLTYYFGEKNSIAVTPTRYELNPATDIKNNDIYLVNDLQYKIEDNIYYFKTDNLEDIFFSSLT